MDRKLVGRVDEKSTQKAVELEEKELIESWDKYYSDHIDELMSKYENKFVAILDEQVVDVDKDSILLAKRVYSKYGYRPVFMPRVSREKQICEFLPSFWEIEYW